MHRNILVLLFVFFIHHVSAQATSYPKGCYMNLDELISKSPSGNYRLRVEIAYANDTLLRENEYRLVSPDKSIKRRFIRKNITAYSDGEQLYINGRLILVGTSHFFRVDDEGHFLVFYSRSPPTEAMAVAGVMGGLLGAMLVSGSYGIHGNVYVLNATNGEIKLIDKETLQELLAYFPELADEYEAERKKSSQKVIMTYLRKANNAFEHL